MKTTTVTKLLIFAIVATAVIVTAAFAFVPVYENNFVGVMRFGRVLRVYDEPGLQFRIPILDRLLIMPKNLLIHDFEPVHALSRDRRAIGMTSYAIWQIDDPLTFAQSAEDIFTARQRLDALAVNVMGNLIGSMEQTELIESHDLCGSVVAALRPYLLEVYGIYLVDFRITRFDLDDGNREAVYALMISERALAAQTYASQGHAESYFIRNNSDRNASVLISQARALADEMRGEAENAYMRILAQSLDTQRRVNFYTFMRSLDTLQTALQGETTIAMPLDTLTRWLWAD